MFCGYCGARLKEDSNFCGKCGTKVKKMPEELKWEEEDTVTFEKKTRSNYSPGKGVGGFLQLFL
ncbi:MAG: zinc ribbon domain-containing protein [Blautia caecimuris]